MSTLSSCFPFVFRSLMVVLAMLPATAVAATYYVDAVNGDDTYSEQQAKSPVTPWKTIKTATLVAIAGDTILVQPGTYTESVESKRDGSFSGPITFQANGAVTIRPPTGTPGFFVSHDYTIIDGFTVTDGTIGIRLGPHDGGDGPVAGLIARNNVVKNNSSNGIQFANAVNGVVEFNTASQNGQNGISYSGNGSQIHDNTANSNGQFGIYVKDGVNHQVWDNSASGNTAGNIKINGQTIPPPGSAPIGQRTFYIDGATGNDSQSELHAQNPNTPWKTIKKGLEVAVPGETLSILPGVYTQRIESLKDGTIDAPITIRAQTPGTVTIQPPSGSAVYFGHHYNTLVGVDIIDTAIGVQLGPYKGTGNTTVRGLVVRDVLVSGAANIGLKFKYVKDGVAIHNIVRNCGKEGISYIGNSAFLFNNLVYNNGLTTARYGVSLARGGDHQVLNNTIYGNPNGGLQLGTSNTKPVFSTVLNNLIIQNKVGVKEPAGSNYTGHATLDYNDVYGNTTNYDLSHGSGTVQGANSFSASPAFINPASGDFRLSRQATGQAVDSPAIDKGSDTAENLNLSGRTAFTDKYPDVGQVDLGYHGTPLNPAAGTTTVTQALLSFGLTGQDFTLAANLLPGEDSDGIEAGAEFIRISFGGYEYLLPIGNFTPSGSGWSYVSGGTSATIEELGNGSVDVMLQVNGLAAQAAISTSMGISVQVGDDFASALVNFRGVLQYP
ncbi:MAG: right-handed parallel beta-helix repeat-containing protein [Candidatus Binatia bacterium]